MQEFETKSTRMQLVNLVTVQAPQEDLDRIMAHVVGIAPLVLGNYDSNSFQTSPGVENYRPRPGAVAGVEDQVRHRPGVCEISFQLPLDDEVVQRIVEEIFQVHSYQEPVIKIVKLLASRSKGLDDRTNPHRWWNTSGDWKAKASG